MIEVVISGAGQRQGASRPAVIGEGAGGRAAPPARRSYRTPAIC